MCDGINVCLHSASQVGAPGGAPSSRVTEMTGCRWPAPQRLRVDVRDCASRSVLGAFVGLAMCWRGAQLRRRSFPPCALIACPISTSARASFSRLFDTQSSGRMGEPSVAGSTRCESLASVGSLSINGLPPRPCAVSGRPVAAPRQVVLAAVDRRARDAGDLGTIAKAPYPAASTSLPRKPPATLVELAAYQLHRRLMPSSSIMADAIRLSRRPGTPWSTATPTITIT